MTKRHRRQGMDPLRTLTSVEAEIITQRDLAIKEIDTPSVREKLNKNKTKEENEDKRIEG